MLVGRCETRRRAVPLGRRRAASSERGRGGPHGRARGRAAAIVALLMTDPTAPRPRPAAPTVRRPARRCTRRSRTSSAGSRSRDRSCSSSRTPTASTGPARCCCAISWNASGGPARRHLLPRPARGRHPPLLGSSAPWPARDLVERLALGPLSEAEVADLVRDVLPTADAGTVDAAVAAHRAGTRSTPPRWPALAGRARPSPSTRSLAGAVGVRDVLRLRLRSLSEQAREVLPCRRCSRV